MLHGYKASDYPYTETGVSFQTSNARLQALYDRCEALCRANLRQYDDRTVMQEGSQYRGVWLETQPMAGEMYAKRNMEVALNNLLIFPYYQRPDGRYPGMIRDEGRMGIGVHYGWLQGFYLGEPALRMAYHLNKNRAYVQLMYDSIAAFDRYLWEYRDSDGDGILETFCTWDTGEDHAQRFIAYGAEDGGFGGELPPRSSGLLPYASMEMMGFSCQARLTLAAFAEMLENGEQQYWLERANAVRKKVAETLWDDKKKACFDRDRNGSVLPVLSHVNLRCMYHGLFSQSMADAFVDAHLMNRAEFWTPVPLPSTAANDPLYRPADQNNWSGPCQGLTYQRAADALMRYGHHAETTLLGAEWLKLLMDTGKLVQQYDAFTGAPADGEDGYGPTMLAALEYVSLLYGVNLRYDRILFSSVSENGESDYAQWMNGRLYRLTRNHGMTCAYIDDRLLLRCTQDLRIETDAHGKILRVIGIGKQAAEARIECDGQVLEARIAPNECWTPQDGSLKKIGGAPFRAPYDGKI